MVGRGKSEKESKGQTVEGREEEEKINVADGRALSTWEVRGRKDRERERGGGEAP